MHYTELNRGWWCEGDTFEAMAQMPDNSADMVLADLPYGTTQCKWDSVLPFDELWEAYWRILKPRCAVVLCSAEPFSSFLRISQIVCFKYDWIWHKTRKLGFMNAKNKPLNDYENINVFSKGTCANKSENRMRYFPQGIIEINKEVSGIRASMADQAPGGHNFGRKSHKAKHIQTHTNYPAQVLQIPSEASPFHPTQKPVALFEYLIRTYTNEGDLVLDNTAGSGTTAIAAINTNRRWWCVERDAEYSAKAIARIREHAPGK